jgi:hypothetical protein
MSRVPAATRCAVISALGERRCVEAVPVLAAMLGNQDLAAAASAALGTIRGEAASQALVAAFPGARGDLKPVIRLHQS